jgi:hypothetical protein
MDDINAPDYAFGLIFAWAGGASAEEYSFHPQEGLDRARNVTVFVKLIANATQLLPSVLLVSSPHGPPCDVVVFDFVPQLLRLLQNPTLMIPECCVGSSSPKTLIHHNKAPSPSWRSWRDGGNNSQLTSF